ncbi:WHG domain-containing protein [Streptomyces sp. S07_1.15]|uniref:TetR-like C-terminal domain-containing protein n=1 Tax=Streptomyces sp. S07_1.15 TaxID=2873925 RepID=UPI001D13AF00|nr:TetR-like C-terminal domain-containing protein [Streptomyces sp. S07_1.15]MCC3651150.1 WHG domain-containing protein [Streptomyces sp. S07_1.15]
MGVSGSSVTEDENSGPSEAVKATARRLLVKLGAAGLSPEAVAREGGLAVAEVEAVFPHRDDLLTALVIDAYNNSAAAMERADQAAREAGAPAGARLLAVTRALRRWSFDNPGEFTLIYGSPVPDYHAPQDTVPPASRTPAVLAGIVRSALEAGELAPPRREVPGPPLLLPEAVQVFGGTPPAPFSDIIERGIVLWSSLIGLLVFQVFSRTHDSVRDESAFFDYAVAVAAEGIGLTVPAGEPGDGTTD